MATSTSTATERPSLVEVFVTLRHKNISLELLRHIHVGLLVQHFQLVSVGQYVGNYRPLSSHEDITLTYFYQHADLFLSAIILILLSFYNIMENPHLSDTICKPGELQH